MPVKPTDSDKDKLTDARVKELEPPAAGNRFPEFLPSFVTSVANALYPSNEPAHLDTFNRGRRREKNRQPPGAPSERQTGSRKRTIST
jgi:hypothetical protein